MLFVCMALNCGFRTYSGNMPVLDRQLFTGSEALTEADWQSVSRSDISSRSIAEVLSQHGWEKKGAAAIGLKLAPDNTTVDAAKLALLGAWDKEIVVQAKKVFQQAAENTMLEIDLPDLSVFRCREGDMWSHYVPQAAIKCKYTQGGTTLTEEELAAQGITEFSVRMVTHLSKDCGAKWGIWLMATILIFPLCDEAMKSLAEDTSNPAWPGIKLADGQLAVLPSGKSVLGGKNWGCPVTPILAPGAPWEAAPGPLEAKEVRDACGYLLNRGCLAEALNSIESLQKRWEALLANPGLVQGKAAEKLWPTAGQGLPERPTAKKGNRNTVCIPG